MRKLSLYYFTADWCSTCKPVEGFIEKEIRPRISTVFQVIGVDIGNDKDRLAESCNVLSVPTVILSSDDSTILWRRSGRISLVELEQVISSNLQK